MHSTSGGDDQLKFATCEMQGWRNTMEDAMISCKVKNGEHESWLFGVFDGHGGSAVSIFCKSIFPKLLEWHLDDLADQMEACELEKEALRRAIISLDGVMLGKQGR